MAAARLAGLAGLLSEPGLAGLGSLAVLLVAAAEQTVGDLANKLAGPASAALAAASAAAAATMRTATAAAGRPSGRPAGQERLRQPAEAGWLAVSAAAGGRASAEQGLGEPADARLLAALLILVAAGQHSKRHGLVPGGHGSQHRAILGPAAIRAPVLHTPRPRSVLPSDGAADDS